MIGHAGTGRRRSIVFSRCYAVEPGQALRTDQSLRFETCLRRPAPGQHVHSKGVVFPFVAECDRTALLAAILTVVARRAVLGPAPMFVVRATTPGSGKTLLAQVLAVLATGHETSPVVFGTDEASTRKAILSIGIRGSGVVLLDNVEGSLGSGPPAGTLYSRARQVRCRSS